MGEFEDRKDKSLSNKNIIIYIILIAFAILISLKSCYSPTNTIGYVSRDVSIWTTIARRMSQGQIMYKDFFDHKGPILYFLYYIGYTLGEKMGIWMIDVICNIVNIFMIYKTSKLILKNNKKSLIITGMSVMYMLLLCEENPCTESIALPFILISLYQFVKFTINIEEFKTIECLCVGISFAIVLLLRPNLAAIWVVYYIYIFIKLIKTKEVKRLLYIIGISMVGVGIVFLPIMLYLIINGAFSEFINTYLLFNLKYTSNKEESIVLVIKYFIQKFYYIICIIGVLYIVLISLKRRWNKVEYELLKVNFIYFLFTFYLVVMPQRMYLHYLIPMISTLIIPLIVGAKYIKLDKVPNIILICMFLLYLSSYGKNVETRDRLGYTLLFEKISRQVQELTEDDDNVLVLGNEATVYLMSNREYKGKYLYQYPIANQSKVMENEIVEEIENDLPDLIIDFVNINKKQNLTSSEQRIKTILDNNYLLESSRIYVKIKN